MLNTLYGSGSGYTESLDLSENPMFVIPSFARFVREENKQQTASYISAESLKFEDTTSESSTDENVVQQSISVKFPRVVKREKAKPRGMDLPRSGPSERSTLSNSNLTNDSQSRIPNMTFLKSDRGPTRRMKSRSKNIPRGLREGKSSQIKQIGSTSLRASSKIDQRTSESEYNLLDSISEQRRTPRGIITSSKYAPPRVDFASSQLFDSRKSHLDVAYDAQSKAATSNLKAIQANMPCPLCGSTEGSVMLDTLKIWAKGATHDHKYNKEFEAFNVLKLYLQLHGGD